MELVFGDPPWPTRLGSGRLICAEFPPGGGGTRRIGDQPFPFHLLCVKHSCGENAERQRVVVLALLVLVKASFFFRKKTPPVLVVMVVGVQQPLE